MRTLPAAEIIVPDNRQRTIFDESHISNLFESIFGETGPGLINPITLREGKTLVAGECRLRAISLGFKMGKVLRHAGIELPAGHVPYVDFGELPKLVQMELEYAENAVRQDLDWRENVKAIAALNELRKAQKAAKGETHTFKETAQELFKTSAGIAADNVSKAVQLVAALGDKEIAGAKSFKEAKKILAKKQDAAHRERLAAATGKIATSEKMQAFHADCVEWMKEAASDQFDVILTDPPYGMGADNFGDGAGRLAGTGHDYKDDFEGVKQLLEQCIPEFYRLAKPEAHLYLWCDIDLFHWLRVQCMAAGWWVHRTPLVNVKPEGGRVPWPEHGPRRCYELCLYGVKGKRRVTKILPDVFESRLVEGNFGHGAQKPVEAYVNLLNRSVRPGDRVFDAFAGTGTIFAAAHAVGCYAVGVEKEAAAFGTCIKRIEDLK